jgi:protein O-GlcNAc transferase
MTDKDALLREAVALHRGGRLPEALASYARYTQLRPNDASGWQQLAIAMQQAGDLVQAAKAVARAVELKPNDAPMQLLAGNIAQDRGDLDAALRHIQRAIRADPHSSQAYNNLGIVFRALGRKEEAAVAFREAVRIKPDYVRAWNNLGSTLLHLEQSAEAVQCLRKAIALDPDYAHAYLNLGLYEVANGRYADAQVTLDHAVRLEPRLSDAHLGLGRLHRELADLDRAQVSLRQAVEINPRGTDAWLQLGEVLAEKGLTREALDAYAQVSRIQPANLRAQMGLALTLPQVYASTAEIDAVRARFGQCVDALQAAVPHFTRLPPDERLAAAQWNNFYLAYQGRDDRDLQERFSRFQRAIIESAAPALYAPLAAKSAAGRRIRVGFVSQFFYECTAGNYFKSWVTKLDRNAFETIVYSLNNRPDGVTREIEAASDRLRTVAFSLTGLAKLVLADELDALIYPELGMNPRVFTLASLRLAPLQCAAWGHPVTTGHENVDVFFSSEAMEPEGAQAHYRERLVTLPGIGTCYSTPKVPEAVPREAFGLPQDAILYLFPQSIFKIHPDNDALLVEILAQEPRAVAVMFQSRYEPITRQFVERLARQFALRGIATAGRIKILPTVGHQDYLRINRCCDVMLDSLYWSGGNTSLDALSAGLPLVTMPGALMRGRQSFGMLSILGLEELVAKSAQEYVAIALRLGRDVGYRDRIRAVIAERCPRLFDQEAPIRALEEFLRANAGRA